jgi:hypothetical protein
MCKGSSVGRERLHRNSEVGYSEDLDILSSGVKGVHILIAETGGFPVGREASANQACALIPGNFNPVGKALKRLEHRMGFIKDVVDGVPFYEYHTPILQQMSLIGARRDR